jgi:Ca2+/H+ antiporter, TMEM165/GDT1 family
MLLSNRYAYRVSSFLVALATFLAAGVEWVEALTIVLAVGIFKSWRTAILATVAALGVLLAMILVFNFTITQYISISLARTAVGVGLLLFGLGWLYKAILRSAQLKAQRSEADEYDQARDEVMTHGHAFGTAFGGVFLEGLEVVFIVVALGGLNQLTPAALGATASLLVVLAAGIVLRHPLTRVPENLVKYAVGVMLTAFGTFFAGEGLGVTWWNGDWAIVALIAGYALASFIFVRLLVWRPAEMVDSGAVRIVRAAATEVWGLFVTDGLLAFFAVAALVGAGLFLSHSTGQKTNAGLILVAGVVVALGISLWAAARIAVEKSSAPPPGRAQPAPAQESQRPEPARVE